MFEEFVNNSNNVDPNNLSSSFTGLGHFFRKDSSNMVCVFILCPPFSDPITQEDSGGFML